METIAVKLEHIENCLAKLCENMDQFNSRLTKLEEKNEQRKPEPQTVC